MGQEWFRYTSRQGKAKKGVRAVLACIVGKGNRRRTARFGGRSGGMPVQAPSRGFILVELITTIVIVGILAAVIGPKLSMLSVEDRGYYDRVRSTLQFAHQLAISSRRCVCVQLQGGSLAVLRDGKNLPFDTGTSCSACGNSGAGVALPVVDSHCAANVTNQVCPGAGVTLTGPSSLQFDPLGRPADGSGNLLGSASAYQINGGGTWSVTVEGESGYVHGSVQ